MKKPLPIPCLLAAGMLLASCNKHIYVPNTVNAPLLKEKYEFKGSISPNNLQAAFALTNHLAIMANGQYVYHFNLDDSSDNSIFVDKNTRGGVIEGAIGFFTPLDTKKRMIFDAFAGYGGGSFKTLDAAYNNSGASGDVNDYLLKTRFNKFFIQPSIGFVHPIVEAGFSSRLSFVKFHNLHLGPKVFENNTTDREQFGKLDDKTFTFIEPAFTVRAGYKYVKFQMQLMFSLLLNEAYDGYDVDEYFQQVALGMGVSVNIGHWYDDFRKKKR